MIERESRHVRSPPHVCPERAIAFPRKGPLLPKGKFWCTVKGFLRKRRPSLLFSASLPLLVGTFAENFCRLAILEATQLTCLNSKRLALHENEGGGLAHSSFPPKANLLAGKKKTANCLSRLLKGRHSKRPNGLQQTCLTTLMNPSLTFHSWQFDRMNSTSCATPSAGGPSSAW